MRHKAKEVEWRGERGRGERGKGKKRGAGGNKRVMHLCIYHTLFFVRSLLSSVCLSVCNGNPKLILTN